MSSDKDTEPVVTAALVYVEKTSFVTETNKTLYLSLRHEGLRVVMVSTSSSSSMTTTLAVTMLCACVMFISAVLPIVPVSAIAAASGKEEEPKEVKGPGNTHAWSFEVVKKRMYKLDANNDDPRTVYCSCPYDPEGHSVDTSKCGLKNRKEGNRVRYLRTEAEHIVPAAQLCGLSDAWTTPEDVCKAKKGHDQLTGRECASTVAPCSYAYTDLHNLWPADGEINADRSDHLFVDDVPGEAREYGDKCDFEVSAKPDGKEKTVEAPAEVTGLIGRVYLYMYQSYHARGLEVAFKDETVASVLDRMCAWNCKHSPTEHECARNIAVKEMQGNDNFVTTLRCKTKSQAETTCVRKCKSAWRGVKPPGGGGDDAANVVGWVIAIFVLLTIGCIAFLLYRRKLTNMPNTNDYQRHISNLETGI